jgi:hypothetical protein
LGPDMLFALAAEIKSGSHRFLSAVGARGRLQ